ncbi:MAG: dihydropteridine reductase [Clostridia bacterium]|nr:dihydropteridine reductase [Clostridia bacterium]
MIKTETAVIEKIRANYTPCEVTKFDELKALDKRARHPAKIFAYAYGSISSLVLGTGMTMAMKLIGSSMGLGVVIGVVGIALISTTYPIYKAILKSRKNKYSKQIFELSDSLLNK